MRGYDPPSAHSGKESTYYGAPTYPNYGYESRRRAQEYEADMAATSLVQDLQSMGYDPDGVYSMESDASDYEDRYEKQVSPYGDQARGYYPMTSQSPRASSNNWRSRDSVRNYDATRVYDDNSRQGMRMTMETGSSYGYESRDQASESEWTDYTTTDIGHRRQVTTESYRRMANSPHRTPYENRKNDNNTFPARNSYQKRMDRNLSVDDDSDSDISDAGFNEIIENSFQPNGSFDSSFQNKVSNHVQEPRQERKVLAPVRQETRAAAIGRGNIFDRFRRKTRDADRESGRGVIKAPSARKASNDSRAKRPKTQDPVEKNRLYADDGFYRKDWENEHPMYAQEKTGHHPRNKTLQSRAELASFSAEDEEQSEESQSEIDSVDSELEDSNSVYDEDPYEDPEPSPYLYETTTGGSRNTSSPMKKKKSKIRKLFSSKNKNVKSKRDEFGLVTRDELFKEFQSTRKNGGDIDYFVEGSLSSNDDSSTVQDPEDGDALVSEDNSDFSGTGSQKLIKEMISPRGNSIVRPETAAARPPLHPKVSLSRAARNASELCQKDHVQAASVAATVDPDCGLSRQSSKSSIAPIPLSAAGDSVGSKYSIGAAPTEEETLSATSSRTPTVGGCGVLPGKRKKFLGRFTRDNQRKESIPSDIEAPKRNPEIAAGPDLDSSKSVDIKDDEVVASLNDDREGGRDDLRGPAPRPKSILETLAERSLISQENDSSIHSSTSKASVPTSMVKPESQSVTTTESDLQTVDLVVVNPRQLGDKSKHNSSKRKRMGLFSRKARREEAITLIKAGEYDHLGYKEKKDSSSLDGTTSTGLSTVDLVAPKREETKSSGSVGQNSRSSMHSADSIQSSKAKETNHPPSHLPSALPLAVIKGQRSEGSTDNAMSEGNSSASGSKSSDGRSIRQLLEEQEKPNSTEPEIVPRTSSIGIQVGSDIDDDVGILQQDFIKDGSKLQNDETDSAEKDNILGFLGQYFSPKEETSKDSKLVRFSEDLEFVREIPGMSDDSLGSSVQQASSVAHDTTESHAPSPRNKKKGLMGWLKRNKRVKNEVSNIVEPDEDLAKVDKMLQNILIDPFEKSSKPTAADKSPLRSQRISSNSQIDDGSDQSLEYLPEEQMTITTDTQKNSQKSSLRESRYDSAPPIQNEIENFSTEQSGSAENQDENTAPKEDEGIELIARKTQNGKNAIMIARSTSKRNKDKPSMRPNTFTKIRNSPQDPRATSLVVKSSDAHKKGQGKETKHISRAQSTGHSSVRIQKIRSDSILHKSDSHSKPRRDDRSGRASKSTRKKQHPTTISSPTNTSAQVRDKKYGTEKAQMVPEATGGGDWYSWFFGTSQTAPQPQAKSSTNDIARSRSASVLDEISDDSLEGELLSQSSTRRSIGDKTVDAKTWKEIRKSTNTLAVQYDEQISRADDASDAHSISEDTINEVNHAIATFREHAKRLGVNELELMAAVREEELSRNKSSRRATKSPSPMVQPRATAGMFEFFFR